MVTLQLSKDGPIAGSVRLEGNERASTFQGWIELMMALDAVRAQTITGSGDAGPFLDR